MAISKIGTASIGVDVIVAEDIAANAITVAELADNAVTQAKLADDAVGTAELANDASISTSGSITTTGAFTSVGIDDNASGATAITIDSSENVGIGTSTITYDGLTLHNSASAGYTYITITNDGTGTGSGNGFNIGVNANEDAILLNRESTNMLFSTAGTERMRIASDGKVGIGTASPNNNVLHVEGNASTTGIAVFSGTADVVYFRDTGAGTGLKNWGLQSTGGSFNINTHNDSFVGQSTKMTFLTDGKVGIGTTTPNANGLTIKRTGSENAELYVLASGTGYAGVVMDASNGDASGGDYLFIYQTNDLHAHYSVGASHHKFTCGGSVKMELSSTGLMSLVSGLYHDAGATYPYSGSCLKLKTTTDANNRGPGMVFEDGDEDKGWFVMASEGSRAGGFRWYLRNTTVSQRLLLDKGGTFHGSGSNDISDENLKENIQNLSGCLGKINNLTGKSFTWKAIDDPENVAPEDDDGTWEPNRYGGSGTHLGLLAQDVDPIIPEIVTKDAGIHQKENGDFYWGIRYSSLIPILIEAVKELSAKNDALEAKVTALEAA